MATSCLAPKGLMFLPLLQGIVARGGLYKYQCNPQEPFKLTQRGAKKVLLLVPHAARGLVPPKRP
jgi:hypothetical protein